MIGARDHFNNYRRRTNVGPPPCSLLLILCGCYLLAGVSSFLLASGAFGVPLGVLGAPGWPGMSDAPGTGAGFEGVAGGPMGAEPEPVPSFFFGRSLPGALVPGCEPGTGDAG
jgi:hypothetical protein